MTISFTLICPNTTTESFLFEGESFYIKRIKQYAQFNLIEPKVKISKSFTETQIKELEGGRILDSISSRSFTILLDEKGKKFSSEGFSKFLSDKTVEGNSSFNFIVGGAYGVSDSVKKKANMTIALSDFTFTYQMSRFILLEQIYRSLMIMAGKPYHKV